jgi:hypothetical protein
LAALGGENLQVTFSLHSVPWAQFMIEFFVSPPGENHGEGREYLNQLHVFTEDSGDITYTFTISKPVPQGQLITATASRLLLFPTSEFSNPVVVTVATSITEKEPLPQETSLMQNYPTVGRDLLCMTNWVEKWQCWSMNRKSRETTR